MGRRWTVSLAAAAPAVARQWHATKNGALTPRDVGRGSDRKVWWVCPRDATHVWQASVGNRVALGRGCPVCAGRVATATTSLRGRFPALAREWHATKNGALTPHDVTPGSNRKAWWRCRRDPAHVWQATIRQRSLGQGCAICQGRSVTPATSLRGRFPALAREWHATKNGALTPRDVTPGSDRTVWWCCRRDATHVWATKVHCRARRGQGCPMCSGRVATPATSLRALHPVLAREWHATKNGALTPRDVRPASNRRVWWRCARDATHVWQATVAGRTGGRGCARCAHKVATPATSLRTTHPAVAREWHPTRNGALTPDGVTAGSSRRVWWRCRADATHVWQAPISGRAGERTRCPMCCGRVATPATSLRALHPVLAREWHATKNGALTPRDVRPASNRRVWWRCRAYAAHTWEATINNRVHGSGCPTCRGRGGLSCWRRPRVAPEWHPTFNGNLTPRDVTPRSPRTVWWRCTRDSTHVWAARIVDRAVHAEGCPACPPPAPPPAPARKTAAAVTGRADARRTGARPTARAVRTAPVRAGATPRR